MKGMKKLRVCISDKHSSGDITVSVPKNWSAGKTAIAVVNRFENGVAVKVIGPADDFPDLEWTADGRVALSLADLG